MVRRSRRNPLAGVHPLRATLLVLFFGLAVVAYGEESRGTTSDGIAGALAHSGFSAASESVISELVLQAAADGIPSELLLPRVQEGVSKGVDAELVIDALSEEILYLTTSRDIIRRLPDGELILDDTSNWFRAANFLKSGQSEEALFLVAQVSAVKPDAFRPATLLFLSISEWGIEPDSALALVEAVVASNVDPQAYPEVTGLLSDAQRSRLDLTAAARQIAEQLRDGKSLRQIARILRR